MKWWQKALIGALGGLAAAVVKFIGQDYPSLAESRFNPQHVELLIIGYVVLTPLLVFLGGLAASVTDERIAIKLLAIGVSAPALITTFAGGVKGGSQRTGLELIGTAYAQTGPAAEQPKSLIDQVGQGVGLVFGYGREPKRYGVIVGSFTDDTEALQFAETMNKDIKASLKLDDVRAAVGPRKPGSPFYPVIVGGYLPYAEAMRLRNEVIAAPTIQERITADKEHTPFLSPEWRRGG